jgi:hypothetical protein
MADNFRSFSKENLKNIEQIKGAVDQVRSAFNSTNKTLKQMEEATTKSSQQFSSIVSSANKFAEVQKEVQKSASGTSKALKEQEKSLNVVNQLNAQIENLYEQQFRTSNKIARDVLVRQINNLSAARDNAKELADEYESLADDAAKLDKSTSFFSNLSEVVKDIPGLRKLSGPFEAAAEASRETVKNNAKVNNFKEKYGKLTKLELKSGKGLNAQRIKDLGLQKDLGKLTGAAAKNKLKTIASSSKTQSAMIAGGKAGFKALGGVIGKAFAPLAMIMPFFKFLNFIKDVMIKTDQEVTSLQKGMDMTREQAVLFRKNLKQSGAEIKGIFHTVEQMVKSHNELLNLSSLNLSFNEKQLESQVLLTQYLGLSGDEAANLAKFGAINGDLQEDIINSAHEGIIASQTSNKMAFNQTKLLRTASKVSGEILANFKGSTKELLEAVGNMEALGISLEKARNMSRSLLDFESSIKNELAAELLIGRDINLEEARRLALNGDYAASAQEIFKTVGGIHEFEKMNVIQRDALAKAAGLTADELYDSFINQKFANTQTGEHIKLLREAGNVEYANKLAAGKLGKEQLQSALMSIDAGKKFEAALANVKDIFAETFDGEMIQSIADAIVGLSESAFVQWFAKDGAEVRANKAMAKLDEKKLKGTITPAEQKQLNKMKGLDDDWGMGHTAATYGTGILGGMAAGAAIGAPFGGVGAIPGAIIGGVVGLFGGGAAAYGVDQYQRSDQENVERERAEIVKAINNQTQVLENNGRVQINSNFVNQRNIQ